MRRVRGEFRLAFEHGRAVEQSQRAGAIAVDGFAWTLWARSDDVLTMNIIAFKNELADCRSYEQIWNLLKRELALLGVVEWIYVFQIAEFFQLIRCVCMNTLRPEWLAHYLENAYLNVDPLFKHFRSSIEPLFWSVSDDWRGYGSGAVAFQDDMREWGYWGGVCLPIQTMDATHGFINIVTRSHDENVVTVATKTAFMMRYVHTHTLRIWIESNPGESSLRARLTPREEEVMHAIADGLTSREIAERLQLSRRTVDSHITVVQEKLQADNRVQALCKAVNLGLLHPPWINVPEKATWIIGSPGSLGANSIMEVMKTHHDKAAYKR